MKLISKPSEIINYQFLGAVLDIIENVQMESIIEKVREMALSLHKIQQMVKKF